jgi:hypothetical protein
VAARAAIAASPGAAAWVTTAEYRRPVTSALQACSGEAQVTTSAARAEHLSRVVIDLARSSTTSRT